MSKYPDTTAKHKSYFAARDNMFDRIYVEIGNVCNLHCSFCPGTSRPPRRMNAEEFETICRKLNGHTKKLFFHVMGEPLCHPLLPEFIDISAKHGFQVCITTNGTLLPLMGEKLLARAFAIHRISISLHCMEGNNAKEKMENYLSNSVSFARSAAEHGIYTVFRLWNLDSEEKKGANEENAFIEDFLEREFPRERQKRWNGFRLAKYIFLEYAGIFTWPSESTAYPEEDGRCHGLIDQIAILADGTVVPCCLDGEGEIILGNIFKSELDTILSSERAVCMKKGFETGKMTEELCRKCTYARRFKAK